MSGYAKRMMEVAAAWLQANPDPDAAIQLPLRALQEAVAVRSTAGRLERLIVEARATGRVDLIRRAEELLGELKSFASDPDLDEKLAILSTAANKPYRLFQGKLDRVVDGIRDPICYAGEAPWLLGWARDGYNVFDLSSDFVAAMLLTDPTAIDLPSLKLPFRGMLFTIPDQFAIGADSTSYTKVHVVETADSRAFDPEAPKDGDRRPALAIYATDSTRILFTIAPRDELSWAALEELPDEVALDADKEVLKTIQRVVLGALAYATAVDRALVARPVGPPKKARAASALAHWTIGREIKIDPELVRVAREGAREIAFRIKNRFIVRGHYRNQAHGPQRSLRTSRWIAPFWKGPEEGARLVHTYKPVATEDDL